MSDDGFSVFYYLIGPKATVSTKGVKQLSLFCRSFFNIITLEQVHLKNLKRLSMKKNLVNKLITMKESELEVIEQKLASLMQKGKIPGLSLSIIKNKEVVYSKGFGNRNLAKNLPVTPDTLFGIGSCTKVFTCLAIMQLAEQGKLSIDDPVNKYIPLKISLEGKSIKIRHLMSHTSGLPNLGMAKVLISRLAPVEETWIPFASKDDFYTFINGAQKEIVDEPGKRYFYFNAGFTMLGEIIENVSKLTYEEYVKEHILKPLKMYRTTFLEKEFYEDKDIMAAYLIEKDTPVEKKHPFDKFIYAAGGMLSSVTEMSNFLLMLLNGGEFEGKRIINLESLQEMFSIQIETPVNYLGRSGYGFGLAISEDFLGQKIVSHGGSTGLSSAQFSIIPELGLGVVTEANVGNGMGIIIDQIILGTLMDKNPEKEFPFFKIQAKFEQLSGEYQIYKGLEKLKIYVDNGILVGETSFRDITSKFVLIPSDPKIEDYKFYIYNTGSMLPIHFEIGEKGEIKLFVERNCFHKVR